MVGKAGLACILELIGIGCNIGYSPSSVFLWGESLGKSIDPNPLDTQVYYVPDSCLSRHNINSIREQRAVCILGESAFQEDLGQLCYELISSLPLTTETSPLTPHLSPLSLQLQVRSHSHLPYWAAKSEIPSQA